MNTNDSPLRPGDLVDHIDGSNSRMSVEQINDRTVTCAWEHEGKVYKRTYHIDELIKEGSPPPSTTDTNE
jgi:hypothetical protein